MTFLRKFFLAFFLTFFAFSQIVVAQETYSRVKINIEKNEFSELAMLGIPIDDAQIQKKSIIIELSDSELQKITQAGFNYEILISDVSSYYVNKNKIGDIIRTDKTPTNFTLGSMGGNLTLSELLSELDKMKTLFPNLITVKQEITTDYSTHNGNYVYWVKISDNPDVDETDEPEILYTALHHAREPVSMMQLVYMMWYLLENYEDGSEAKYLIDNFEMYFILCENPDGYLYNEQTNPEGGGMWRKNCRDNDNNGEFIEANDGVDPNRNYPYMWGINDDGSSPDSTTQTYRGPSAGSEPITQMMMEFINAHNILICDNHHTYSNLLLYSWAYDEIHSPDQLTFEAYSQIMTEKNGYATGQPWEILYTVNGDSNDWMYGEHGILAFTSETGNEFWPPQSEIIPLCEENLEMNLFQTRLAGAYADVKENSPNFIKRCGYLNFNIAFLGLDTTASYKIYLSGDNIINSDTLSFSNYSFLETKFDSLFYIISDEVAYGEDFSFQINADNGKYIFQKPITKTIQKSEVFFDDNGNDLTNWTSSTWNTTSSDYHSQYSCITDSPSSDYSTSQTTSITSNSIDLSSISDANLSFWAQWDIETDWDYAQILVSTNDGSSWTPLETDHTTIGDNGVQPFGEPVYEGSHLNWVNETINLSGYLSSDVKFKFILGSDGAVEGDGFYFDDFQIIAPKDDEAPVITGQNYVNVPINHPKTINLVDLVVTDNDNNYPTDFTLIVSEGANYSLGDSPNVIIPDNDYLGNIIIPVRVCDGYKLSEPYNLLANVTTSINTLRTFDFQIYPNPTSTFVNIIADNSKFDFINIIDITGNILISKKYDSDETQISVSNLDAGIYFVQLKGESIVVQKIVIVE